ncbi:hypothetical protein HRG_002088 [Hirsutella rhossiliensis]|uniref:Uncharacterized protein n=1 Tax=Hirsutella rhossiliensis TaxID=111463 RepID=A0A9P8SLV5_9HYPO|nr:uncharacterized protein HRG_02088 [Hirsutella rhossiliensis]KAH0966679.1 hypothetical protein HRG_02088 [Hirsutella rhossiliensis]
MASPTPSGTASASSAADKSVACTESRASDTSNKNIVPDSRQSSKGGSESKPSPDNQHKNVEGAREWNEDEKKWLSLIADILDDQAARLSRSLQD